MVASSMAFRDISAVAGPFPQALFPYYFPLTSMTPCYRGRVHVRAFQSQLPPPPGTHSLLVLTWLLRNDKSFCPGEGSLEAQALPSPIL